VKWKVLHEVPNLSIVTETDARPRMPPTEKNLGVGVLAGLKRQRTQRCGQVMCGEQRAPPSCAQVFPTLDNLKDDRQPSIPGSQTPNDIYTWQRSSLQGQPYCSLPKTSVLHAALKFDFSPRACTKVISKPSLSHNYCQQQHQPLTHALEMH
jgi:hypothetical protein